MKNNSYLADINEIYLAYYLNNEKFFDTESEGILRNRESLVPDEDTQIQKQKAKLMAQQTLLWAKQNGYAGAVRKVWWTARIEQIKTSLEKPIQNRYVDFIHEKNPSDIVIQFSDGKFLGVSAKTFKDFGSVSFLNAGVKTIEKDLKISIQEQIKEIEKKTINDLSLPQTAKERKQFIRNNEEIQNQTKVLGTGVMSVVRDKLYEKLKTLNQNEAKEYILKKWLRSDENLFPPYVRVICIGSCEPFEMRIQDPIKNEKINALTNDTITFEKLYDVSIGIKANDMKIFKIRVKYTSECFASSVKIIGESWLHIDK